MATVQLNPRVVADLVGILEFIAKRDPVLAAITNVREAVQILARHRWSTLATASWDVLLTSHGIGGSRH
jgi:hypothetical protein